MWAPIARKIVIPSHERLLGRPTMRYLRELDTSQWLSPSALREVQGHKLRELLRHAHANVPFYRRRMERASVDIDASDPFDALSRLPLLDKPTIRRCVRAMPGHDAPGGPLPSRATGRPGNSPPRPRKAPSRRRVRPPPARPSARRQAAMRAAASLSAPTHCPEPISQTCTVPGLTRDLLDMPEARRSRVEPGTARCWARGSGSMGRPITPPLRTACARDRR